jgi:hypothetical protein
MARVWVRCRRCVAKQPWLRPCNPALAIANVALCAGALCAGMPRAFQLPAGTPGLVAKDATAAQCEMKAAGERLHFIVLHVPQAATHEPWMSSDGHFRLSARAQEETAKTGSKHASACIRVRGEQSERGARERGWVSEKGTGV